MQANWGPEAVRKAGKLVRAKPKTRGRQKRLIWLSVNVGTTQAYRRNDWPLTFETGGRSRSEYPHIES